MAKLAWTGLLLEEIGDTDCVGVVSVVLLGSDG